MVINKDIKKIYAISWFMNSYGLPILGLALCINFFIYHSFYALLGAVFIVFILLAGKK